MFALENDQLQVLNNGIPKFLHEKILREKIFMYDTMHSKKFSHKNTTNWSHNKVVSITLYLNKNT